jgi:hypothetical protein
VSAIDRDIDNNLLLVSTGMMIQLSTPTLELVLVTTMDIKCFERMDLVSCSVRQATRISAIISSHIIYCIFRTTNNNPAHLRHVQN